MITLWYDAEVNCQHEDFVYSNRTIFDAESKQVGDTFNPNNKNYYIIELHNVYKDVDLFSLMSTQAKSLLRQGLKIILYYPKEGHSLDDWLINIYKSVKHNDIEGKIYLVFGDNDLKENYKLFLKENVIEDFLVPISIDFFAKYYLDAVEGKNKDYLFYNGKLRPHRLYAVSELDKHNVLDKGIVSLTATEYTNGVFNLQECVDVLNKNNAGSDHLDNFVDNFKPMILDIPSDKFSLSVTDQTNFDHYGHTYFSVISETSITHRFVTEKIYKAFYNLHPFIVIGPPKMLQLLKEKGYQTFEELFDESYDNEPNHVKRVDLAIQQIVKFCNLSESDKREKCNKIMNKLYYNREHYIKSAKSQPNIFKVIDNED